MPKEFAKPTRRVFLHLSLFLSRCIVFPISISTHLSSKIFNLIARKKILIINYLNLVFNGGH